MLRISCKKNSRWLTLSLEALRSVGCVIIEDLLPDSYVTTTYQRMYQVREKIVTEIGEDRLQAAKELGVLRLMLKFDSFFLGFLEIPELLALVDRVVSSTAILHLQNGFILPPFPPDKTPETFQNNFHRDFSRFLNGYVTVINILIAVD